MPVPRRPVHAGFTIVEVMMAVIILVVGFFGLIDALSLGAAMMDHARRQTLADQIMQHEIEKLRLASWSTISGLPTAATTVTIDQTQFATAISHCGATYTLTRTLTNPDPYTNIREVNFTITWVVTTSRKNNGQALQFTYSRSISAYYGKYGLNYTYQRT